MKYYHVYRQDTGVTIAIFRFKADAEYFARLGSNYRVRESHKSSFPCE